VFHDGAFIIEIGLPTLWDLSGENVDRFIRRYSHDIIHEHLHVALKLSGLNEDMQSEYAVHSLMGEPLSRFKVKDYGELYSGGDSNGKEGERSLAHRKHIRKGRAVRDKKKKKK
jgi:hypothetical protein